MTIELKYPITVIENGEKKEVKFLTPSRLKVKHFELLPETLLKIAEENKGQMKFSSAELVPMFKELIPFLAGIFNLSIESIKDIDFEDIEKVIGCLEEVFPKDEKKN
jgi:hypothetical protein